jgi:hypothetical protein
MSDRGTEKIANPSAAKGLVAEREDLNEKEAVCEP